MRYLTMMRWFWVLLATCWLVLAPASAAAPAIKARLAFVHAGALWTMAADGTARTRIVGRVEPDPPAWSPRGDRIALTREGRDGAPSVWIVRPDGSGLRRLFKGSFSSPAWSRDGRKLAVASERFQNRTLISSIAVSNLAGTVPRVVVEFHARNALDQVILPRWTPDGHLDYTKLVIAPKGVYRPEIRVVAEDGTGDRLFLSRAENGSWSPDGRWFAYGDTRGRHGQTCGETECFPNADVAVVSASGAGRRVLTHTNTDEDAPSWSPDGRLAFSSGRNTPRLRFDAREIYTISRRGKCLTWLTNGTPDSSVPVWSPRGGRTTPGRCGSHRRKPRIEVRLGHSAERPLWLGPTFGAALLSGAAENTVAYEDCASFFARGCPPMFLVRELDACGKAVPDQRISVLDIRALSRGSWVGRVRVGRAAGTGRPLLLAGHTLSFLQVDSRSTAARTAALARQVARALRLASSTRLSRLPRPALAERFRRQLPLRLRAKFAPCPH